MGSKTFDALTEPERKLLRAIAASQTIATPLDLAGQLGWTRQKVVRVSRHLEEARLISVHRLPKQSSYSLAPDGRDALDGTDG